MKLAPSTRPALSRSEAVAIIRARGITDKVVLIGQRGFFLSMGAPGRNDRGLYDDAIFVVTPASLTSFNANVDPSAYRAGRGTGAAKGMATLMPGVHQFTLGLHRGKYLALRQAEVFHVKRDGRPDYIDIGDGFGINIHRGGENGTSSLGCQTIVPDQWQSFIALVKAQMNAAGQKRVRYILLGGV